MRKQLAMVACSVLLWGTTSCGDDDSTADTTSPSTTAEPTTEVPAATDAPSTTQAETTTVVTEPALEGTLTIMAPGPFKGLLEAAKTEFEAANPGVTIELNLGHVPTLLTQLEEGVVADVLITPDAGTMGQAGTKGLTAGEPAIFAKVPMALVVPAGNAAGVVDVSSLAN